MLDDTARPLPDWIVAFARAFRDHDGPPSIGEYESWREVTISCEQQVEEAAERYRGQRGAYQQALALCHERRARTK